MCPSPHSAKISRRTAESGEGNLNAIYLVMLQKIHNIVRAVKMVSVRWGKVKYSDVGKMTPK